MGYRGKLTEKAKARRLRGDAWTLEAIARHLGVSKSSVSLWVRDVPFVPQPRATARRRGPNVLQRRKAAEIEALKADGADRLGVLSEQAFLAAGAALYAGEGAKGDGEVVFANSDPRMIMFFCAWLRHFFAVDEGRLRVRVYLHDGLDLHGAQAFWSEVTDVPLAQFGQAYRAVADRTVRANKHVHGCAYVRYNSARTHRAIMGLVDGLLRSSSCHPG